MKLARVLNPRATHRDTLVMRRSLDGDEDQGADALTVVCGRWKACPSRARSACYPKHPTTFCSVPVPSDTDQHRQTMRNSAH